MYILKFWKAWPPVYKRLWTIIACLFIVGVSFVVISFLRQPEPVFTWGQLEDLRRQEIPIYSVEVAGINLPIRTENYIVFERWLGNPMHLSTIYIDIYFFLFVAAVIILLSIISTLPRFWFLIVSSSAILMVSTFRFEALEVFGLMNKVTTIMALTLLIGPGIYFQFLDKGASLATRILTFTAGVALLGVILLFFAHVAHPFRYLAINTIPTSIFIIVIFIIVVAHEIMASFITLVGKGGKNSNSFRHFMIISVIYLINLWLTYLDRINSIDWGYTVSPTILLVISGILAIWGIRQREPQYGSILSADPFAVYLIAALGIISFSAIGYFTASSNDLMILSLNDLILYAHIGYGMIFLMYAVANFAPLLQANEQVYRILYKPKTMPYFTFRFGALVFTAALLFYNNWIVPKNHFISGYNTALGDLFIFENNPTIADGYYRQAFLGAPYNQHAANALAEIEPERQREYFKGANSFRPTEFTLLNGANSITNDLQRVIVLEEAYKALPHSGAISNSLGLAYAKVNLNDSAYKYFSIAGKTRALKSSSEMNLLGLLAQTGNKVNSDSIIELAKSGDDRVKSNALAVANHEGKVVDMAVELPKDSILNLFSASLIANYITNHINKADTAFLTSAILIARKEKNKGFTDIILLAASKALYANGHVNHAFTLMQELVFRSNEKDTHNTTMALWALDQGKADVAIGILKYGISGTVPQTSLVNAVAISETGRINEAIIAWDSLQSSKDPIVKPLAESMTRVLAGLPSWYTGYTDNEKYLYLKYRVGLEDSVQFSSLVTQIKNEDLKAKAVFDRSKKLFDNDDILKAAVVYRKLQGLHLTDLELFSKIKYFELRLFAAQAHWSLVDEQIKKGILFGPYRETERVYFDALRAVATNDRATASRDFEWIARNNYYFDDGIIAAANFFKTADNQQKSYAILSEAIQVNPSVKIVKAYIVVARFNGFDDYAAGGLELLQPLISQAAFKKFVAENELSGLLLQ